MAQIKKTLLITGASGFLGTWISDAAYAQGYTLIGIDLRGPLHPKKWKRFATSSTESVDLLHLTAGEELFGVLHLAGGASVYASVSDPYGDFSSLVPGSVRLALFIAEFHPNARMFLFSSASVYGNPKSLPIKENSEILPISPYGTHKAVVESVLEHYTRIFDLKVTVFRIFSVYGLGLRKQLIWDVAQRALEAASAGKKSISVYGTGFESRDFIHVHDLCVAALQILDRRDDTKFEIYNLASGIENTVKEVVDCLVDSLELDLEINYSGESREGDPINWRADVDKLSKIGFLPKYNITTGIKDLAESIKLDN